PLRSMPRTDPTLAVLQVTGYQDREDWLAVSGRARLVVEGHLEGIHVGDEVEVVGRLTAPQGPANPGEVDEVAHLRDQRIRAPVGAGGGCVFQPAAARCSPPPWSDSGGAVSAWLRAADRRPAAGDALGRHRLRRLRRRDAVPAAAAGQLVRAGLANRRRTQSCR